ADDAVVQRGTVDDHELCPHGFHCPLLAEGDDQVHVSPRLGSRPVEPLEVGSYIGNQVLLRQL
ncbi:hypothetical protein L195_g064092, partial [Trifolium pratense]